MVLTSSRHLSNVESEISSASETHIQPISFPSSPLHSRSHCVSCYESSVSSDIMSELNLKRRRISRLQADACRFYTMLLCLSLTLSSTRAMVTNRQSLTARSSDGANALTLLNTARILRENRSPNSDSNGSEKVAPLDQLREQQREHLLQINRRSDLNKFHENPSRNDETNSRVAKSLWTQALFDDENCNVSSDLLSELQDATNEADISSRVEAHLPSLKSLQTSLGSEIPDMELRLQMEAAKARIAGEKNGVAASACAALAFMDVHHSWGTVGDQTDNREVVTGLEKMAMSYLPSQLPGPAANVFNSATASRTSTSSSDRVATKSFGKEQNQVKVLKSGVRDMKRVTTSQTRNATNENYLQNTKANGKKIARKNPMTTVSSDRNQAKVKKSSTIRVTKKVMNTGKTLKKGDSKPFDTKHVPTRVSHEEEIELAEIVQKGVNLHNLKSEFEEKYKRDITRQEWTELAGLDSPKEIRRLVSNYRRAKSKLVMANMGLVHAVVRTRLGNSRFGGKGGNAVTSEGVTYEELVQEGSLGLMRAAELFDPSRGLRFSTYATIWIKGVLSNSKLSETIALPRREKDKWNKIQKASEDLISEKSGSADYGPNYRPTAKEIASKCGLEASDVEQVLVKMTRARNVLSLDYQHNSQGRSGTDRSTYDALGNDKNLRDDVDLVERLQLRADIVAALARNLDPREARLVRLRYGLKDGKTRTIVECAEAMGISRARAQQLAAGCLKKLREADDAESLQEYLLSIS